MVPADARVFFETAEFMRVSTPIQAELGVVHILNTAVMYLRAVYKIYRPDWSNALTNEFTSISSMYLDVRATLFDPSEDDNDVYNKVMAMAKIQESIFAGTFDFESCTQAMYADLRSNLLYLFEVVKELF